MILKHIKKLNYKAYDALAGGITIDEIILKINGILDASKNFLHRERSGTGLEEELQSLANILGGEPRNHEFEI